MKVYRLPGCASWQWCCASWDWEIAARSWCSRAVERYILPVWLEIVLTSCAEHWWLGLCLAIWEDLIALAEKITRASWVDWRGASWDEGQSWSSRVLVRLVRVVRLALVILVCERHSKSRAAEES